MNAKLIIETEKLSRAKTNHILHIILSLITVGWWIPVWIICSIGNNSERKSIEKRIQKLDDID